MKALQYVVKNARTSAVILLDPVGVAILAVVSVVPDFRPDPAPPFFFRANWAGVNGFCRNALLPPIKLGRTTSSAANLGLSANVSGCRLLLIVDGSPC